MDESPLDESFPTTQERPLGEDCPERRRISEKLISEYKQSQDYQDLLALIREKNLPWFVAAGHIFESIALNYYYSLQSNGELNRTLAAFLRETLENPKMHSVVYHRGSETLVKSGLVRFSSPVTNPDALSVKITKSSKGERIALITGVIDAKLGKIRKDQRSKFINFLYPLVSNIQREYKRLVEGLDIYDIMPKKLKILPKDQLTVTYMVPQVDELGSTYSSACDNNNEFVVPVYRREVLDIYKEMTLT